MTEFDPKRGEIWKVRFDMTIGQEIRKDRRAVVMNVPKAGRPKMRIIVPITTGRDNFDNLFWMTRIQANSANRLDHDSFADISQIQAASMKRFYEKMGVIDSQAVLDQISAAIAFCVGYSHQNYKRKRK